MKKVIAFLLGIMAWTVAIEAFIRVNELISQFRRLDTHGRQR